VSLGTKRLLLASWMLALFPLTLVQHLAVICFIALLLVVVEEREKV
jgi:hypothetical protein